MSFPNRPTKEFSIYEVHGVRPTGYFIDWGEHSSIPRHPNGIPSRRVENEIKQVAKINTKLKY